MSRLPLLRIGYDDAPEISSAIEDLRAATVLLDVEPLVCLWNTDDDELAAGLTLTLERIVAVPSLRAAVFITNSRRVPSIPLHNSQLAVSYLHSARKPWVSLEHFRVLPRPFAVVGDQPLTDGLLAWRLRAPFVQLGLPERTPPGIRLQARLGGAVLRTLFASA